MRRVIFGENILNDIPEALTIEQIQGALTTEFPSIANAVGVENEDGDFVFTPKAAEKGC